DQREVDVGHLLPDHGRLGELRFPVGCGEVRIERRLEIAGDAADARAVGHEAVSDQFWFGPLGSCRCIQQEAIFQSFQSRTDRMRPWCALKETASYSITKHGEAPSNRILVKNEAKEDRRT